jgi:DNA polymerase I-like protein with 3'-5' exonuclease and polymerase domains
MDATQLKLLAQFRGETVYLRTEPEVLDFTSNSNSKLFIYGSKGSVAISLNQNLIDTLGVLRQVVFNSGKIIAWNIKSLFSYVLAKAPQPLEYSGVLADLKVLEAYIGERKSAPKSFQEARARCSVIKEHPEVWKIYKKIHLPLIKTVIPQMEVLGVLDKKNLQRLHANYEIEGQVNGRLKCPKAFSKGFNPHSIGPIERDTFSPIGENVSFVHLDFKHYEVSVLAWLSKDPALVDILSREKVDFYREVYKLIVGKDCESEEQRDTSKSIFLPLIFGLSEEQLAKKIKKSIKLANFIVNRMRSKFQVAFSFVQQQQDLLKLQDSATDYLDRIRYFDKPHLVRNFIIQAPASMVCLEKLIKLSSEIKKSSARVAFHVHDGYYLYVPTSSSRQIAKTASETLEAPSELLPGLRLKVACKIGPTLNDLIPV